MPKGNHQAELEDNLVRGKPSKDYPVGKGSLKPELRTKSGAKSDSKAKAKSRATSRAKSRAIVVSEDEVEEVTPPVRSAYSSFIVASPRLTL